ncbi:MAG: peptidoglycan DD-metalloendopeptidase family protein [Phycisphaera sp.]|nr:peptidoglycan DD-metalloendopeptidase family protein [Phycisphaera sp.]
MHATFISRIAGITAVSLCVCTVAAGASDDDIRAKIAEVRAAALRINLDGDASDWAAIPTITDAAPTPTGNPGMDIEAAAIAPLDSELLVMIRTRGRPLKFDHLYRLNIDYRGDATFDIQVALSFTGAHAVWANHDNKDARYTLMQGVPAKIGDVIEASITYEDLAKVLPADKAADLMGAAARGWVRVRPFTMRLRGASIIDEGPAVASYRLTATPPPLDDPMPMRYDGEPAVIALPGAAQWYVSQGADGAYTHQRTWAYDLNMVDRSLNPYRGDAKLKESHLVWDMPILAPVDATVTAVDDAGEDHTPYAEQTGRTNSLVLNTDDGRTVVFYHLRQGSAEVKVGDRVTVGQTLAHVGNSGGANYPHLHVQTAIAGRATPTAFRNVRVSLNPVADDPWARDLDTWSPREGFLVEPQPSTKPQRIPR